MKHRIIKEYWNTTEVFYVQTKKWYGWIYKKDDFGFRSMYNSFEDAQKAIEHVSDKSKKKIVFEC